MTPGIARSATTIRSRSSRIASRIAEASSRVAERGEAGGLGDGRQVVGQAHALEVVDHLG